MRIIEVCPYDMNRPGGVQKHVNDLAAWLRANGHEVLILAPRSEGDAGPGIRQIGRVRNINFQGTHFELCVASRAELAALDAEMKAFRPDVVHLHTPWTPLLPWQVWRRLQRPSVATFHATLPEDEQKSLMSRLLYRVAGYFIRRLESIIVPSASPLAPLRRYTQGRGENILAPTIDLSPWRKAGQDARRTGAGDAGPTIAFLGRLEARKGVATLLKAWDIARASLPEARLCIAGSGAQEALVRKAAAQDKRIQHIPAPDDAAARALVAQADIFVAPAPYGESFGLVLIEAMAAGAVPVAAANSGYSTVMTGPGARLLFPPEDAEALAARLCWLAGHPEEREALADWGREHAASFDVSVLGPSYLEVFRRARDRI